MKKLIVLCLLIIGGSNAIAQQVFTLDSCRNMAINNNKQIRIANEKIKAAGYEKKSAFANYLPGFDAVGGYMYNSKEISLLSDKQKEQLSNAGTNTLAPIMQQIIAQHPELGPQLQQLGAGIINSVNGAGQSLVNALRTNTTNMFGGAITLTQPIYMGGKIRAYNQITKYAEELAKTQKSTAVKDLVFQTDEIYWQVVSLVYKKKLAESYADLLDSLYQNVEAMIAEGVATQSDGLTVAVKQNEAQITLTKVSDGLSLSKMLLAQICGLPINMPYTLADEIEELHEENLPTPTNPINMDEVYANRSEIQSLTLATEIYKQKQKVALSAMLPNLALTGSYMFSNPNVFNSFEKRVDGFFNVGVMLKIPVFHWGKDFYKVKAAKTERNIALLNLEEAKEKIELQVNQATFKVNEANKKLIMTRKNMEKAEENLRYATLGFREGVIATSNVLEAQTAWLSAQSEKIDAQIDVKLTEIYLKKSLGTLQ